MTSGARYRRSAAESRWVSEKAPLQPQGGVQKNRPWTIEFTDGIIDIKKFRRGTHPSVVGRGDVTQSRAPLFAIGLRGLARALGRVAGAGLRHGDSHAATLMSAILGAPWAIAGRGRANTVVIEQLGILAKGGAEGVIAMATQDGTAVAVKVLDGSPRVTTLVALELLAQHGAIDRADADRVMALTVEPVLGGGVPVGRLRVSDKLSA